MIVLKWYMILVGVMFVGFMGYQAMKEKYRFDLIKQCYKEHIMDFDKCKQSAEETMK